jgi:uncharacterized protein YhhL (DUF1145 family)
VADDDAVHPVLRPFVWVVAGVWLPLRWLGRTGSSLLMGYDRWASAAGRAVVRAARRAAARLAGWLRPLGRLLMALARLVHHWWLVFLVRVVHPVAAALRRAAARVAEVLLPLARAIERLVRGVLRRLEPVAHALQEVAARLGRAIGRITAPVVSASRRLGRAVRSILPS